MARETLGFAVKSFDQYKEHADALYHKPCEIGGYANGVLDIVMGATAEKQSLMAELLKADKENEAAKIERELERRQEVLDDIVERSESERCGVGSIRGTAWACFNAVTEHADHSQIGRQSADLMTRASRRFESSLVGDADNLKQVAFQHALAV